MVEIFRILDFDFDDFDKSCGECFFTYLEGKIECKIKEINEGDPNKPANTYLLRRLRDELETIRKIKKSYIG